MSERRKAREKIINQRIISLNKSGLSISEIANDTGKSKLHVKNTILRNPAKQG